MPDQRDDRQVWFLDHRCAARVLSKQFGRLGGICDGDDQSGRCRVGKAGDVKATQLRPDLANHARGTRMSEEPEPRAIDEKADRGRIEMAVAVRNDPSADAARFAGMCIADDDLDVAAKANATAGGCMTCAPTLAS